MKHVEVQGHRGARGLIAENTLPSFEIALDVGVDSIETDVHLTRDGVPVLFHDAALTAQLCPLQPIPANPLIRALTLDELRQFHIGPAATAPPVAQRFATQQGLDPFGIPTLSEFFAFVSAYADAPDKSDRQRERARRLWFDLEMKRIPFHPETIGDGFTGSAPALLEIQVAEAIRRADMVERTRVRSFDHRSVLVLRQLEPRLAAGLLIYHTAPAHIGKLLDAFGADLYCPDYHFVDAEITLQVHDRGKRIIPYTVNEPRDWQRLIDMDVDGITTDYPDRLIAWLAEMSSPSPPHPGES
jgi:glycerophosphoryl diester phosphodiesterase